MKKSGVISAFRFGKNGVGISLTNGDVVPVSEQLLNLLARSCGFATSQQLVLNGAGATINYEVLNVTAGQPVMSNDGKPVLDTLGNPRMYSKDHTRYNNISIQLSQQGLIAANIGATIGAMFANTTAVQASVKRDIFEEDPAEAPVPEAPAVLNLNEE